MLIRLGARNQDTALKGQRIKAQSRRRFLRPTLGSVLLSLWDSSFETASLLIPGYYPQPLRGGKF